MLTICSRAIVHSRWCTGCVPRDEMWLLQFLSLAPSCLHLSPSSCLQAPHILTAFYPANFSHKNKSPTMKSLATYLFRSDLCKKILCSNISCLGLFTKFLQDYNRYATFCSCQFLCPTDSRYRVRTINYDLFGSRY